MFRNIVGKVHKTTDIPWVNIPVIFQRVRGSYTADVIYPPDIHKCKVDNDGNIINCQLWVNETGDQISTYTCIIGKDRFSFSIPPGDGSPIDIADLRAGSNPVETYPQTIIAYIDEKTATAGTEALKFPFSQASVINNAVDINHNLQSKPLIQVYNNNDLLILPDNILQVSANVSRIVLDSFAPITGQWLAILRK